MVTVFGDAVVPRGGSVWLGTLLEVFAGMGIGAGVVRTAMSRLAADGWVERTRIGRNSFYRLTGLGDAASAAAAGRIYGGPAPGWDGRFHLLLAGSAAERDGARDALQRSGFGAAAPGVWIAPSHAPIPPEAAGLLRMTSTMHPDDARELAARAWPLRGTADAYRRFLGTVAALQHGLADTGDLDALVARTLLIHGYRRIVLRDPCLPLALLPDDWPGTAARRLCADVYRALLPASERWLDRYGRSQDGPLPPAAPGLRLRFGAE